MTAIRSPQPCPPVFAPRALPPRRRLALRVRAGAPWAPTRALVAPLLASAHTLLAQPAVTLAVSGMAAAAVWAAQERPILPPSAKPRGAARRDPEWARKISTAAAAAVPLAALVALQSGMRALQINPANVEAAAVRGTLCAGLAGVHAALAASAVAVHRGALSVEQAPGLLAGAAALAAALAPVAYTYAVAQGARWAPGAPTAVMWACYGAALGQWAGGILAERLRAAHAPAWCQDRVLQSATCGGAAAGVAAAVALWRV